MKIFLDTKKLNKVIITSAVSTDNKSVLHQHGSQPSFDEHSNLLEPHISRYNVRTNSIYN